MPAVAAAFRRPPVLRAAAFLGGLASCCLLATGRLLRAGLLHASLAPDGLARGLLRCGLAPCGLLAADGLASRSLLRRSLLLAAGRLLRRRLLAAAGTHGQRLCARLLGWGGGFFVAHRWKLLLVSSVAVARVINGRPCSRVRTRPAAAIEACRQASFIGPAIQRGSSSSTRASAARVRKRDKLCCASSGRGCGQWTVLLLSRALRLSANVLRIGLAHTESAIPRLAHACQQKATVSSRV